MSFSNFYQLQESRKAYLWTVSQCYS